MSAGRPRQTAPEAWVQAALDEIEESGVEGLAVEAVARRLGVSKGGFYHHFTDRRALLRAALGLWEERFVRALTASFDAIADPAQRLRTILDSALLELEPTVIVQLMAAVEDPDVRAALARATDTRLALLTRTFRDLGFAEETAAHRALTAYGVYLGIAQLRREDPAMHRVRGDAAPYLDDLARMLRSQ